MSRVTHANLSCPVGEQIECFLFAGWGSVSGTCSTCEAKCSVDAFAGPAADLAFGVDASRGPAPGEDQSELSCCAQNAMMNDSNTFCDCRSGVEVAGELAGDRHGSCWRSCMDCFGDASYTNADDDAIQDCMQTAYPPERMVKAACLGRGSCTLTMRYDDVYYDDDDYSGCQYGAWEWDGPRSVGRVEREVVHVAHRALHSKPKFKAIALCAPSYDDRL